MTIEDARRPGATALAMSPHRQAVATPPASILDRPTGRSPRTPGSSRTSTVAKATLFGTLLPDRLADLRSGALSASDCRSGFGLTTLLSGPATGKAPRYSVDGENPPEL